MQDNNLDNLNEELDQFLPKEEITDDKDNTSAINENGPDNHNRRDTVSRKPIPDLKELTFVRLIDPIHIPSYLVEQIKDRLYTVDKFYQYQKIACTLQTKDGPVLNNTNLLYAITHEKLRQTKGFLWMVVDILTNSLIVNNFSIDKEYWNRGESTKLLEEKAKKVMKDLSLSRIVWITKNSKFCENKGFKRSKDAIMIYEG